MLSTFPADNMLTTIVYINFEQGSRPLSHPHTFYPWAGQRPGRILPL